MGPWFETSRWQLQLAEAIDSAASKFARVIMTHAEAILLFLPTPVSRAHGILHLFKKLNYLKNLATLSVFIVANVTTINDMRILCVS